MATRQKPVRLAVFDIDGTIFRSSLIIEAFNALVESGVFPKRIASHIAPSHLRWLNRQGHYNDYLYPLVESFYQNLAGKSALRIRSVLDAIIAYQRDRIYRFTRDLISECRKKKYHLLAISGSPHDIVERFATAQSFDGAIGRTLETVNGVYTGRILYHGAYVPTIMHYDKPRLLAEYAEEHGFSIDYRHSIAVGDSEGDIELLSVVGRPIAFNPSSILARHARRNHWRIVVERKDVIYEIRDAKFLPVREQQHIDLSVTHGKKKC